MACLLTFLAFFGILAFGIWHLAFGILVLKIACQLTRPCAVVLLQLLQSEVLNGKQYVVNEVRVSTGVDFIK
jgi:uncharacterized membrane protein YpjA